jgi:hypothetical protein
MNETTSRIGRITQDCEWAAESGGVGCGPRRLRGYSADQELAFPQLKISVPPGFRTLNFAHVPGQVRPPEVCFHGGGEIEHVVRPGLARTWKRKTG